jgi:RHS repeat-associated protein
MPKRTDQSNQSNAVGGRHTPSLSDDVNPTRGRDVPTRIRSELRLGHTSCAPAAHTTPAEPTLHPTEAWPTLVMRLAANYARKSARPLACAVAVFMVLALLAQGMGPLSPSGSLVAYAHPLSSTGSSPHHFNPKGGTTSTLHFPPASSAPKAKFTPRSQRPMMAHGFRPSMNPGLLTLDPNKATRFIGSDGRLEIDVPAGAVNATDLQTAGGSLALSVKEIAPASGSNAGGSGLASLGTYLVQLVDAHGKLVGHGLRAAATLKLHYGAKDTALNLARAFVVFNGSHPQYVTNLGAYSSQTVVFDAKHRMLQATLPADLNLTQAALPSFIVAGVHGRVAPFITVATTSTQQTPSTSFTWDTYAPVAKFGSPDPLNVDLNAGSVTDGLQIDVPAGPAGAMPNITLAYDSAAVSEQHSPQGAAGWVGEGWSMSLGSISWAEHNVQPTCSTCGNMWEDSWYLTDPFGTSTELIPPNITTSTYYDDTPNWYCATGNSASTPCPVQFHTARETHAKVYAYVGPVTLGSMPQHPPCFRVYQPNGVMEEFGCTADSIQYYPLQSGSLPGQSNTNLYYPVNWMLDLITNPQGDQVHITYQNDTETAPDGLSYPRDTVMATIEWDSPTCVSAQTRCAGTSSPNLWQPLYRVNFVANHHTVTRLTNTPANCNTDSTVRCDDPTSITHGIAAPLVNGTFVLNDIQVQTNPTSGGSYNASTWNTVRDYQFSYEQSGPTTITDPATGKSVSTAGYLDLTQIKEVGDDGVTAYPPLTFGYSSQTEYYEDGSFTPYNRNFCGPTWNTGGNGGTCDLWSESYAGNSRYLASVSNGQGLQQTLTWNNARDNTHGVNAGGSPADPFYCNTHQTGYPCNSADDQGWSRTVVTQRADSVLQVTQNGQGGTQTSTPVTSQYAYTYQLSYPLVAQECGDCVAGMYWGNQNDGDYLDYYNGHFMGFTQTSVSKPDGSIDVHKFYATEGWGVYDTSQGISCAGSSLPPINTTCHAAPWWHTANAGHGLEYETDYYDTNGSTLLKKVTSQYQAVCPPSGVSGTPSSPTYGTWDGNLVSELDHNNPVATCDVLQTQKQTTQLDGGSNSVYDAEQYTYDSYGRLTKRVSVSNSGGSSPTQITYKTSYVWNDGLVVPTAAQNNTPQTNWSGTYLINTVASTDTENGVIGTQYACQRNNYDSQAYTTGQTSGLTAGNQTEQDKYAGSCGSSPTGALSTTTTYDAYGNAIAAKDADANSGVSSHVGGTGSSCPSATACAQYDSTTEAKPTSAANDANQSAALTYNAATDQSTGYGLWLSSSTNPNGGVTTYTYDALGRRTSERDPGQTTGPATTSTVYTVWCSGSAAQSPCVEIDTIQRLDSSHTTTTRKFYDGFNRLVETRTPAPGGQDVVTFTLYNVAGEQSTTSVQYFVTAYTGAPGSAAYSIPDSSQTVTTYSYDGLGRTLSTTDPLSHTTQTAYSVVCNAAGTSDSQCYEQTLTTDANNHRHGGLTDGFGRLIYDQRYSGSSSGSYVVYSTTKNTYDFVGNLTQVLQPDGTHTTYYTYDTAGRMLTMSDPDRGVVSNTYDANDNLTQQIDARCGTTLPLTPCSAGTIYTGYDGLNRPIWRNNTNSPTGAYVTYAYDEANHGFSAGHLTTEQFNGGPGGGALGAGAYSYTYDALGRKTAMTITLGGSNYTFNYSYNDANMPTSLTYSDGEVLTDTYDGASGWLTDLITTPSGGSATNLLTGISYSGSGGAAGRPTNATVASGAYTYSASYDAALRPTDSKLILNSLQSVLFDSSRAYDAVGNVTGVNTTLAAGTDNQAFCYDEQNRLTWASSASGSIPCGGSLTAGTLTSAQYTASYGFDTLDRMTAESGSAFTYGDSSHLHALTSTSAGYSAAYDQAGNMTCRAPASGATCAGTPTGAQLTYDNQGQLTAWQNAPATPTTTETMAYDGDGRLVARKVNGGTPTYYLDTLEEITGATLTKYFTAAGLPTIVRTGTGGTLSYLMSDALGSLTEALDGSGNVAFQQLYNPYGGFRYTSGTAPTSRFFTGQMWDATTGLYDYVARYYDAVAHQFTSADTAQDGLNHYTYVLANPETNTDPTGHWWVNWHWWGIVLHFSNWETQHYVSDAYSLMGWGYGLVGIVFGLLALMIPPPGDIVLGVLAGLFAAMAIITAIEGWLIQHINEWGGYHGVWGLMTWYMIYSSHYALVGPNGASWSIPIYTGPLSWIIGYMIWLYR